MYDDVGVLHKHVDGRLVEDVPLKVFGLRPTPARGVEGTPRHPDNAGHGWFFLERIDEGLADITGRARYRTL